MFSGIENSDFSFGVGQSLVAGLILMVTQFFLHRAISRQKPRMRVYKRDGDRTNSAFYDLLFKSIKRAKNSIYQFAEGFDTTFPDSRIKSEKFKKTIGDALERNKDLKWIRIQTKADFEEGWRDSLMKIQKDHVDRVSVLLFDNKPGDHIASYVLIDPESDRPKVFIMISRREFRDNGSRAHTGILVENSQEFATSLLNRLNRFSESDHIQNLKHSEDQPLPRGIDSPKSKF